MNVQQLRRAAHEVRSSTMAGPRLARELLPTSSVESAMDLVHGLHEADLGSGKHRSTRDSVVFGVADIGYSCQLLMMPPRTRNSSRTIVC